MQLDNKTCFAVRIKLDLHQFDPASERDHAGTTRAWSGKSADGDMTVRLSQSQKSLAWIAGLGLIVAVAVLALLLIVNQGIDVSGIITSQPRVALQEDAGNGKAAADDLPIEQFLPNEVLNLDAQDAMARNLALPVSSGPNPVAPAFVAHWLGADLAEATKCLATAVYYESAGEPMAGQRAVAQVVLNRLRNPRYPKTICGVVYEGAERPTGCQFSFACDGSTRREPGAAGWAVATAVATSVLNGVTSVEAGQATHYHTLAVFPAWAPQLAKISIIGHHVFYRPPGRATYGYEAIPKTSIDPPLAAVPVVMPLPDTAPPPLATINVPAVTAAGDPGRPGAASSSRQSAAGTVGASDARQSASNEDDQSATAAPSAAKPRRSMFPTRQTRTPNLPLAADH